METEYKKRLSPLGKVIFDSLVGFLMLIIFAQGTVTSIIVTKLYKNSTENVPKIDKIRDILDSIQDLRVADSINYNDLSTKIRNLERKDSLKLGK